MPLALVNGVGFLDEPSDTVERMVHGEIAGQARSEGLGFVEPSYLVGAAVVLAVEEYYDELERICTERVELSPGGPVVALNIPAGQWHTVRALESGSVILEMKEGPYKPTEASDILK